jgi:hypothetical protein
LAGEDLVVVVAVELSEEVTVDHEVK